MYTTNDEWMKNTYTKNKTAHRQGHAHTTGYGYDKTRRLDVAMIYSFALVFFFAFLRSIKKKSLSFYSTFPLYSKL